MTCGDYNASGWPGLQRPSAGAQYELAQFSRSGIEGHAGRFCSGAFLRSAQGGVITWFTTKRWASKIPSGGSTFAGGRS